MAGVLAVWRFGADLHLTSKFAISTGLFSHWQVWFAVCVFTEGAAFVCNRAAQARSKLAARQGTSTPLAKSGF
jgi:hypothetical protein